MTKAQGLKKKSTDESEEDFIVLENSNDDLEEVQELFLNACSHLNSDHFDKAKTFLRATVNECDRLLRIKDDKTVYSSVFYETYAQALIKLCLLTTDQDEEAEFQTEILTTAMEMIEKSIQDERLWSRSAIKAEITLNMAKHHVINNDDVAAEKALITFHETIKEAIDLPDFYLDDFIQLISQLREFGEQCCDDQCISSAIEMLNSLKSTTEYQTMKELATCKLSLANVYLESLEFDDDSKLIKTLEECLLELEAAESLAQDETERLDLLVLMCECCLNLGNVVHDMNKASGYHQRSVEMFDIIRMIDKEALPEDLVDIIEELRSELKGQ